MAIAITMEITMGFGGMGFMAAGEAGTVEIDK